MNAPQEFIPLRAELVPTPEITAAIAEGGGALAAANACEIDSQDMAELANSEMKAVKAAAKKLDELRREFVAPAKQIIESADRMFKPSIEALTAAEGVYKRKLLDWTAEQQRIAEEARRAQQEAERKARAEAEAKAAAERARAEQEAAEKRRQAAEAEEARRKAEAEGNRRAAAAAAAAAAKAEAEAREKIEAAEQKAAIAQMSVQSAPVIAAPVAPAGFVARTNWVAELSPGMDEPAVIAAIAKAITEGRTELLNLLGLNWSAANRLAKSLQAHMSVPGLVAANRPIASSRAK